MCETFSTSSFKSKSPAWTLPSAWVLLQAAAVLAEAACLIAPCLSSCAASPQDPSAGVDGCRNPVTGGLIPCDGFYELVAPPLGSPLRGDKRDRTSLLGSDNRRTAVRASPARLLPVPSIRRRERLRLRAARQPRPSAASYSKVACTRKASSRADSRTLFGDSSVRPDLVQAHLAARTWVSGGSCRQATARAATAAA